MQFGFTPGRGKMSHSLGELKKIFLAKSKNLYHVFVDQENTFNRVPRNVLWWAIKKLGIDELIIRLV